MFGAPEVGISGAGDAGGWTAAGNHRPAGPKAAGTGGPLPGRAGLGDGVGERFARRSSDLRAPWRVGPAITDPNESEALVRPRGVQIGLPNTRQCDLGQPPEPYRAQYLHVDGRFLLNAHILCDLSLHSYGPSV